MKNLVLLAFLALTTISCQKTALHIDGDIDNLPDGKMYLSLLDTNFRRVIVDSTIIQDGKFTFDGMHLPMAECVILSDGEYCEFPIFAGDDNVSITGDLQDLDNVKVTGSKYFDIIRNFGKNIPEQEHMEQLQREYYALSGNVDRRQAIKEEMESIQLEQLAYIKRMIYNNIASPVAPFILSNYLQFFDFEDVDQLVDTFKVLQPDYKYVRTLSRIVEHTRAEIEATKLVEIGCKAPNFSLPDINGKTVSLSDFRGKRVLIEFWYSQFPQCRTNNENLNDTYSKFANLNFEIITVAFDKDIDQWREIVQADNLQGTALIDTSNHLIDVYCPRRLPFAYLIDETGVIVSKDLEAESVFENINRFLK